MSNIYRPRSLFSGAKIGKDINKLYVGVPDTHMEGVVTVKWKDKTMTIPDWKLAETFRVFEDKFQRDRHYTLGYFEWKEDNE